MGQLRERMEQDLKLKNLSPATGSMVKSAHTGPLR